jgi:adenine C2-methylase RlmN of 23S rRNA A2503 and tRNA A37
LAEVQNESLKLVAALEKAYKEDLRKYFKVSKEYDLMKEVLKGQKEELNLAKYH